MISAELLSLGLDFIFYKMDITYSYFLGSPREDPVSQHV